MVELVATEHDNPMLLSRIAKGMPVDVADTKIWHCKIAR